jgi:hypothetical protein
MSDTAGRKPSVRPSFVLKKEHFLEWSRCGGWKRLAEVLDLAVAELVEKHRLVDPALASDCREWLGNFVHLYFRDKSNQATAVTERQSRQRSDRIRMAAQVLIKEIPVHCWLSPFHIDELYTGETSIIRLRVQNGLDQLREFLEFVHGLHEFGFWPSTAKQKSSNAAKPALREIGSYIHASWGNCWRMACDGLPLRREPRIAGGSPYLQYATYIYGFVGEPCEGPALIARLKKAKADFEIQCQRRRKKTQR